MSASLLYWLMGTAVAAAVAYRCVRVVPQAHVDVIERLGRFHRTQERGLHLVIPVVDRMRTRIDLREQVIVFPPQPVITSDSLVLSIEHALWFQVTDPVAVTYEVANHVQAIEQLLVTTLRRIIAEMDIETALGSRDAIDSAVRTELDGYASRWGLRIHRSQVKAIEPPEALQQAIEQQTRVEWEERAAEARERMERKAATIRGRIPNRPRRGGATPADGSLRPGDPDRLGPYRLTARLGAGGQGVVYLATGDDAEQVAIKVIRDDWVSDGQFRERLTREAESARKVAAFCIARVLDADLSGEFPYIVSEYVAGPSLQEDVRAKGPRPASALYRLAVYTATALMAIHDAGIVHRDFKPGNVLLGPDGPRVIDFGIARALEGGAATITHGLIGTPSYMPPEQFRSEPVGPPADIFAWACVIVYAATGRPPFGDDRVPAVMRRILDDPPEIGDLEPRLRTLILRCLAKDPARRPTARAILLSLVGRDDHGSGGLRSARQLIEAARDTVEDPPARER